MTKDRQTDPASPVSQTGGGWAVVGGEGHDLVGYASTRDDAVRMARTSTSWADLGRRAAKLRMARDMSVPELASRAGVNAEEISAFERGDITSVSTMIAVHHVLSGDDALDHLFAAPRFETIEDVVAYEARRRRA